jgi:hydrocephalus-inducing protein
VSGQQLGKIQIIHSEHPHREFVELVGEVCFPNIRLEQTLINFGSILNDTSKKIVISMENVSEMPIFYEWTFVEEELV